LTWWLSELAGLAPPQLMWLVGKQDHTAAVLEVSADDIALVLPRRGTSHPLRVPLSGCDEPTMRARIHAVTRHRRIGNAVTVRLDPGLILETSVTLPVSAEPSLRAVLQHQLDRLVPVPARDVCFEYRLAPRMPAAKELTVNLLIATRASIDRALALAKAGGLNPRQVVAAGDANRREAPIVLWRAGRQGAESPWHRRLRYGMEAAAIVLALSTYGLYVYRLDMVRNELQEQIGQAARQAEAARHLSQQIADTTDAVQQVQRRYQEVPPLRLLNELTTLVPDSSWITQLVVRNRSVEIVGYSPRATDLIPRFEGSALFEGPQFRAPITLAPDGKGERFDLTFAIRPEQSP
jgi:general secretion pathway protein L